MNEWTEWNSFEESTREMYSSFSMKQEFSKNLACSLYGEDWK